MADPAMRNVVESLPVRMRSLFAAVIGAQDPSLLESLMNHEKPSEDQRLMVQRILAEEFARHLGQDDEPTDRGRDIDDLIGAFVMRWPVSSA
jgi:hypothetical protein